VSIRTLIEVNHDYMADFDKHVHILSRVLCGGVEVQGIKVLHQRHHSDVQPSAPAPKHTPWRATKLRTRTVVRSADGGLVCVIESGADREQVEAMIAAVNGYAVHQP
jgi:hypothetical protein